MDNNLYEDLNPFTSQLQLVTEDMLTSRDTIPAGHTYKIPSTKQMHVQADLVLVGDLDIAGDLVLEGSDYHAARQSEVRIATKTNDYTLTTSDHIILIDASSNAVTITLPTAASSERRVFHIKRLDNAASTVTIDPNGSETIDGATTKTIAFQYTNIMLVSDGTEWWIL